MFGLQIAAALFWMAIVPLGVGYSMLLFGKQKKEKQNILYVLALGIAGEYGLYELLFLPFVFANGSFRVLTFVFAGISLVAALAGFWLVGIPQIKLKPGTGQGFTRKGWTRDPLFWVVAALVLIQILAVVLWAAPDPDDYFYIGLSSVAISQDTLMSVQPYGGIYGQPVSIRYVMSALPLYQGSIGFLSFGLHPAIVCHTLFAIVYYPVAYGLYALLGRKLLPEGKSVYPYLIFLGMLEIFGGYYNLSAQSFFITRIWQGKALLVTFILPFLWYQIVAAWQREKGTFDFIITGILMIAAVFVGQTAMILVLPVAGVLTVACMIKRFKVTKILAVLATSLPVPLIYLIFMQFWQ